MLKEDYEDIVLSLPSAKGLSWNHHRTLLCSMILLGYDQLPAMLCENLYYLNIPLWRVDLSLSLSPSLPLPLSPFSFSL